MSEQTRPEVDVSVSVKITENQGSSYDFEYSGDYFDSAGNFNFANTNLKGKSVRIHYSIDAQSAAGVQFKQTGDDAFWIIEESIVGPTGCPGQTYRGSQFQDWVTSADRLQLHVLDLNSDGLNYRYALRFDRNGATIVHDPGGTNDNGG